MLHNFCKNFENSKWLPFLARQKFFENWDGYYGEIPCGPKISSKSLYLARFSRYKHFCVLQILQKNSKIQNGRHFWRHKIFLKLEWLLCRDTLWVKSFVQIALSSTVFQISAFLCFAIFVKNSKWEPFLARQKFFEN